MIRKLDRTHAIADLRTVLLRMVDQDHSMCEVAARKGIFCRGFAQWSFDELKSRYGWIASARPDITRPEFERLANAWQLARQRIYDTHLSCDTESEAHYTCLGFEGMCDSDLARFHAEVCGEPVEIVPLS